MKEQAMETNYIGRVNNVMTRGDVKKFSNGDDKDYVSKTEMILPDKYSLIPDDEYSIEYKGDKIIIVISTINKKETDPVFNNAKIYQTIEKDIKDKNILPTDHQPKDEFTSLPFEAFTDNRGKYPAVKASLWFPKRIVSWLDNTQNTGINMEYSDMMDSFFVTGIPENKEKVLSLIVLNKLIHSLKIKNLSTLTYEDVTIFLESYFKKPNLSVPLVNKINLFTTKNAYRNAISDYYLPNFKQSTESQVFLNFNSKYLGQKINNETDLKSVISDVIENILKHQIESRRWIQPFWDGEKTVKNKDGEDVVIPREPKDERDIQPTLYVILDMALLPLGIQVIRESDEGIGSIDFRFLFTTETRIPLSIGVEFKLAHHKKIEHGLHKQLPAYLNAIRSNSGIYVIMWFKDSKYFNKPIQYEIEKMEDWICTEAEKISEETKLDITTVILDVSIKPSASNL